LHLDAAGREAGLPPRNWHADPKIHLEIQGTQNSQNGQKELVRSHTS